MILSKIPPHDGKMSYEYDERSTFHYVVENGITFLCMSMDIPKRRIPFTFLDDIRSRFRKQFGEGADLALAFSLNESFSPVLMQTMEFYNHDPASDSLTKVKSELQDVKGIMVQNIEKVLERGERIELLVDKTDRLNQTSFKFEKASRQLKNVSTRPPILLLSFSLILSL